MQPRCVIDPFSLNLDATAILNHLLKDYAAMPADKRNSFLPKNTQYFTVLSNGNSAEFCFTNDMVIRPCANPAFPGTYRIEVLSNKPKQVLGEGAFGAIEPIEGTLKQLADGTFIMKSQTHKKLQSKERVVKKEIKTYSRNNHRLQVTMDSRKAILINEYQLANRAGHLHVKEPVFQIKDNIDKDVTQLSSYMVMKQLRAIELFDSLVMMIKSDTTITIDQRINLAINLLIALKEQVHDKGIVHRDIKPENIMVNFSNENPIVYLIDYGLAIDETRDDEKFGGSYHYMSPEVLTGGNASKKSDIYSMSHIIGMMFGADPLDIHNEVEAMDKMPSYHDRLLSSIIKKHMSYTFNRLFKAKIFADPEFSTAHRQAIETILKKGRSPNADNRASLPELINVFTTIQRERLSRHTPVSQALTQASESNLRMTPSESPISKTPSPSIMRTSLSR